MMRHRTPAERPKQDTEDLIDVRNLRVSFATRRGRIHAVNGVDLTLREGESIGLVGESGSGKSVTCRALLGLLPEHATVEADAIRFSGTDVAADREGHAGVRGGTLALVGQDPIGALNPHVTVGTQIDRVLLNQGMPPTRASERTRALLEEVGIDPRRRDAYPGEFSGGMCQRIAIALALATGARVLIADEPTSSLDVTTQTRILELLERLRSTEGLSLVLVTHDFDLAGSIVTGCWSCTEASSWKRVRRSRSPGGPPIRIQGGCSRPSPGLRSTREASRAFADRRRSSIVRERYLCVLASVLAIAAALAGDPWLAWGGPHPAILLRALGFMAVYAAAVHHTRRTVHVPQTRDLLVWSWRLLAVVLAMPAYAETLANLS